MEFGRGYFNFIPMLRKSMQMGSGRPQNNWSQSTSDQKSVH